MVQKEKMTVNKDGKAYIVIGKYNKTGQKIKIFIWMYLLIRT